MYREKIYKEHKHISAVTKIVFIIASLMEDHFINQTILMPASPASKTMIKAAI